MTMIDAAPALRLRGRVVRSGDARWDMARQAFNLTVDQRPAAIAFPVDAADVADAVRYARAAGLRVAPQRTGHNAAPLGSLDDGSSSARMRYRASRSTRSGAAPASTPARSGRTSCPPRRTSASRPCTARPAT